jgi:hypothetical protein
MHILPFVPAKAGTQGQRTRTLPSLGPRFRGGERNVMLGRMCNFEDL